MQEAEAAVRMLADWSSITVTEALLMLSGRFGHAAIRERAIHVLQQTATDSDIYSFTSQLVQCVRFDGPNDSLQLAGVPHCLRCTLHTCPDLCPCPVSDT